MQNKAHQNADKFEVIQFFETWIAEHIHRPIKGFEHKRNSDGTFFNKRQQILATRVQILAIVSYFLARGKSAEEIREAVQVFQ